ncbi:sigma-70 family RNA polymerase sigma factor [Actinacidiphila glaucinigra]|uniref:sigma-70 family RNA polymerase sigma factor n=1 Tax=Actinacidiphila glaucinigra TaxID=235986 RepID=UPI00366EB983
MNQPPSDAHRHDCAAPADDAAQLGSVLGATEQALASAIAPQIDVESALAAVRRRGGPPAAVASPEPKGARELFAALCALPARSPRRRELRDQLVGMHLPLIEDLTRRLSHRGEPAEALMRVAAIGLNQALDRCDTEPDLEFPAWATRTVLGELTRHFRDQDSTEQELGPLPELRLALTAAVTELTARSGRAPTVREVAEYLQITEEEVLEGLKAANTSGARRLDRVATGEQDPDTPGNASPEEGLPNVEQEALKLLLEQFPPRERQIAMLRLLRNRTTVQIASEVGISEAHVTRILTRTMARLRNQQLTGE